MTTTTLEDLTMGPEDLISRGRILVVDDEYSIRYTFSLFLDEAGYKARAVADPEEALAALEDEAVDVAFVDILLESTSGIDLMAKIKERSPATEVVIVTGAPSVETASDSLRLGAFDYLVKPVDREALLQSADVALRHKAVRDGVERYRMNLEAIFQSLEDGIVTVDQSMNVVEVNGAAERLCGFRRKEILGNPLGADVLDCSAECLEALKRSVVGPPPVVVHHLSCHARHRPAQVVNVKATPLVRGNNGVSGGVLVIRDQTRLEDLEESLRRSRPGELVGQSAAMRRVRAIVESLGDLPRAVLITGEVGAGKEVVADALHASGRRRPMLKVDCSVMSDELLERELFGYVKGAFVGAVRDRVGRLELAQGGCLFLDEIADMSPRLQKRFLDVLNTAEVTRLGETEPIPVDVRVLAATSRDLDHQVSLGLFRPDLYSRLKELEIHVPSLRERREDIPALVHHRLAKLSERLGKRVSGVSSAVLERFLAHPWPGNVRELEQALEHAILLTEDEIIHVESLPAGLRPRR